MPRLTPREFQERARALLERALPSAAVEKEWSAFTRRAGTYAPRLDLAVGPFAVGTVQHTTEHAELATKHRALLQRLHQHHEANLHAHAESAYIAPLDKMVGFNVNARCFLGIEIENEVSRKHLLGGCVNASALSRLGVLIPWTPGMLRPTIRALAYLRFLAQVEKNTFDTTNLLVIQPDQFMTELADHAR